MTVMLDHKTYEVGYQETLEREKVDDGTDEDLASDLLDEAYAATIDPMRFDDLLVSWQDYVNKRLAAVQPNRASDALISPKLEAHLQRAFAIFERIGRQRQHQQNADSLVADMTVAALVIDRHRRIIASNDLMKAMIAPTRGGQQLNNLPIDDDTASKLDAWLCKSSPDKYPSGETNNYPQIYCSMK